MKKLVLFTLLMLFGMTYSVDAQNVKNDVNGKKLVQLLKKSGLKYNVAKDGVVTVDVAMQGNREQKVVVDPVEKYESDTTGYSIVSISAYVYKDGLDAKKLISVLKQNNTLTYGSFAVNDEAEKPYVYYGVFLGQNVTPEEILESILFAASQADAMEQIFTPGVDNL